MACVDNIKNNDRSFDCFLPLYLDSKDSNKQNNYHYGTSFNINENTNVEARFMNVDQLQSDLELSVVTMDNHVENFKKFMKVVHEDFYKKFKISSVTNQQIARISKAVNITNQTFSALDLWLSVFSDHVGELYEEIERYQNSKTKVILIMNKIQNQVSSSRTDPVVKFKRDETFKQSLGSERNRLLKIENSIRSKLYSLNNYYAKFERGLIPLDRKSDKMINLKNILKIADMVYGTSTKLSHLQLEIVQNINNQPSSIIYRSEQVPNVLERISKPVNYIDVEKSSVDREPMETEPINDHVAKNVNTDTISVWSNNMLDAEELLTNDSDKNARLKINESVKKIRAMEQDIRPIVMENVRLQIEKEKDLNAVDDKMRENMISAEIDRQLKIRAAELSKSEQSLREDYERRINDLHDKLDNSKKMIDSLKSENELARNRLIESDNTLKNIQAQYVKQQSSYHDMRFDFVNKTEELNLLRSQNEKDADALDSELVIKNTRIRDLESELVKLQTILDKCQEELRDLQDHMSREKIKNNNLVKDLKQKQSDLTELETRFYEETKIHRETEASLKAQLNNSNTRVNALQTESDKHLKDDYKRRSEQFEREKQLLENKYRERELQLKRELEKRTLLMNEEMLQNTNVALKTMQDKIDELKRKNAEQSLKYNANIQSLRENITSEDRIENEKLRTILLENDLKIKELTETVERLKNTPIVDAYNVSSDIKKRKLSINDNLEYDVKKTNDSVIKSTKVPNLHEIKIPLSKKQLDEYINSLWTYTRQFDRDRRENVIKSMTFEKFDTFRPSDDKDDTSTCGPVALFELMNDGDFHCRKVILMLAKYWLYYKPTAQFIHACLEKTCWSVLDTTDLFDYVTEIVENTPDKMYNRYVDKLKNMDRYDLVLLENILCNIPKTDVENIKRFNELYHSSDKAIDLHIKQQHLKSI